MNYEVLKTEAEVSALIEWHNANSEYVVVDIETTGLDPWKDEIVDVQIGGNHEETVSIFSGANIGALKHLQVRPVGHNLKFDVTFLFRHGVEEALNWRYHDTLLLAHLENENRPSYALGALLKEFYGPEVNYKTEFWSRNKSYHEAPEEERLSYASKDVYYTSRLYRDILRSLGEQGIPSTLIEHVHRLQYSLLKTEIQGIKVDVPYLTDLGVKLKSQIEALLPKMREVVSLEAEIVELDLWKKELARRKTDKGKARVPRPEFTFDSSAQLQTLLYGYLALPTQYNEKTKAVSVDDASLERIKEHHPVVPLIQEYRETHKVYGTYIEGTLERMRDGRIYPEFRVNGTKTGRISHSNPNLGQLPKSGGIRGIYVPDDGNILLSADFSQLEVCLEANLTGDPNLARIFTDGLSKHDITARELGVDRHTAKTLNFALQYWCTARKVAKLLGVNDEEGERVWKRYWEVYSGPKALKERTDRDVILGNPIITRFGRRRRFVPGERNPFDGDLRQAYNFLIQGTGADLTSRAFYLTSEWLGERGIGRGLFTVHDEIIIEVRSDYAQEAEAQMLSFMTQVGDEIGLKISLKAESSGPMLRWED